MIKNLHTELGLNPIIARNRLKYGNYFGMVTVAQYNMLPFMSLYQFLDPGNGDTVREHCRNSGFYWSCSFLFRPNFLNADFSLDVWDSMKVDGVLYIFHHDVPIPLKLARCGTHDMKVCHTCIFHFLRNSKRWIQKLNFSKFTKW